MEEPEELSPYEQIVAHRKRVDVMNGGTGGTDPLGLLPNSTSLEVLQAIYRNPNLPIGTRHRAARDAAPFEYPKYAVIGHARPDGDWAVRLDRAIERSNQAKLINSQAKAIEPPAKIEEKET